MNNEKIKVVEVIGSFGHRGGAEVFLSSLCSQFIKNPNIDLTIIALHGEIDKSFEFLKKMPNSNFLTVNKKRGIDLLAAGRFKKIIKKINPNIIHIHTSCFATYFLAFGFSKHYWRIVETIHTFPGYSLSKIEIKLKNLFMKKNKLTMISISESLAKMANIVYPYDKGLFIYNGFCPSSRQIVTDKIYDFIIVASMTEVKNHKLLFDALKLALISNPKLNLVCLGDGVLMKENMEYVKKINIKNNIIFLGQIDNPYEYLNQSKIIILSSKREGNPISLLEGMSFGLPVIAPNIGGIPDIVTDGENGLLFEVDNKEQLSSNMLKLIDDKELYFLISNNNKKKAQEYTIDACANKYFLFFNEVALSKNKKA